MFKVVLHSILSQTISDTAKVIYIQFFNDVVAVKPKEGILKLPTISQLSLSLHIRKHNVQQAINELIESELIELFNNEGKTYYQLRFVNNNENHTTPIDDPAVWSDRNNGASAQYISNPYTQIPDAFFYSKERVETKIKYCMFSACLKTANISSFSATIIKRFIPSIPDRTARSALLKLEELGWISLELVDSNNCRLGYKKIEFMNNKTHIKRIKAHTFPIETKGEVIIHESITEAPVLKKDEAEVKEEIQSAPSEPEVKENIYVGDSEEVKLAFKKAEPVKGSLEWFTSHHEELEEFLSCI